MHDLTAQVTSSLLPFPGVTTDALGEDEITLDSILHGRFTVGRSGLAWLACGPHLEVVHAVTGERLSAYCFSSGAEHPPSVLAARDFSWLKRSGLLVGLEETEGSVLCLYDLGLSRVVKAVVIPGRITAIEPLVSYGGASASTQHLHQSLRWFFGIAAVVTDLGHVLLVDLCLDDLSCSQTELEASDLQIVTKAPAEIPRLREVSTRESRHLCLQLNGPSGVSATALQYISRTNHLAVGFSDGHLQLWNMKTLKKEYHSQLEAGRVPVHAFTFQEPENDPRNCCYLWAVQSSQNLEGDMVSLHLLQLAFSERKCLPSGKILYEGLEYCEERYSQELGGTAFPARAQSTNIRLLNCQTIEKFRPHPDRDDSMNEVASPDTSVSIFSWQVKAYGQGRPSSYIGVFDINRWYHAQMPDSLRMGESFQNCPYLAVWSLDTVEQMVSPHVLIDVVVHDRSMSRGLPFTWPPPEQYFNPTTYNFDATCLLNSGIVHLTCSGYQKETLSFLRKAAPCSSDIISTSYSRCLMSGLLSSRLADTQASSLSQEEQLDAILSTAVETSSLGLITGCIKQWTAEEQPGSALNLRYILDWAWNKVVQTKDELDGICAPLFDSSSNFTDPQTLQLLQHSQRLLGNLSTIFHCLLSEAQELTHKGLMGLINKNMVSSLISKYAQVVLWFCRTGLLPEASDEDTLQISRPFYTHSVISNYYAIRREELTRLAKGKWCADCLMIDGLVNRCGERLTNLWKRDEGGTGQYPPPTLHALLDIYLLENIDEATKHAIVIYLLLDVMYSFPNKEGASIESFPTAFAIPIGLVKLVQGLWLLDHHDHQSSFELLLHPSAGRCQFDWQHERVLQALMCQGQHSVALRYFHVTKPPISSTSQAKLCLSVLLHNRCLTEAWSLIRLHSSRLNMDELLGFLYESCQELGLIKELLKLPLMPNEQECLEKFLQCTGGLQNRELLMVHYLQHANYIPALQLNHSLKMNLVNERDPKLKERSITRNAIMEQYGKVLPRVQRKLAMERSKPYQHPNTVHREVSRPQPLSTITKRSASDKLMSRAGFISNVLTKIEEVWSGKEATPQSSPARSSPKASHSSTSSPMGLVPDPFLGTPITMSSKRKSRLLDLVVHPSCQPPRPLLSPPRPPSSWVSPKRVSKAPELSLLQTPQVVKRARALAASGPVFSGFTPQSILRSSLRPTPVATPSASPGRSITPPLRTKESRISFIKEMESPEPEKGIRWTNGMAADTDICLLTRSSTLSKASCKTWPSQLAEEEEDEPRVKFVPPEGGVPSPQLRCSESEASSVHEAASETRPSDATQAHLSISFDTSHISARSTDTTLEYYDAPQYKELEGDEGQMPTGEDEDMVTLNIKTTNEEKTSPTTQQSSGLLSEDREEDEAMVTDDKALEDMIERGLEQEAENKEDEEKHDVKSSREQEETPSHSQVCNQVTENTHFDTELWFEGQQVNSTEQDDQAKASGFTVSHKLSETYEPTNEAEGEVDQSTDLTKFVEQHLFGSDLASPLTRSGIHDASLTQVSFTSEFVGKDEEEEQAAAEAPPVFSSQKSSVSVTSSEPTGTDSHSVVSVNDSEELSSPMSEEEEDDDDDDEEESESDQAEEEEEEQEDSGSEVEIIEEVQGNGRLPPLQSTSVFVQQGHTHFLPTVSEQEAAHFSLITPGAEMKMVEEDMEGEVVMVRLGADEAGMLPDQDEVQASPFVELKPSTTLLVPLELVEEQQDLVDGAELGLSELQHAVVQEELRTETHSNFSLMLDMEEDVDKEAHTLSIENDLLPPDLFSQCPAEEAGDEHMIKPEDIFLDPNHQEHPQTGDSSQEVQLDQMDGLDGPEFDRIVESEPVKLEVSLQTENTAANPVTEDAKEQKETESVILPQDQEPAAPMGDLTTAVADEHTAPEKDAAEETGAVEDKHAPDEYQEETEINGPVNIDADSALGAQMLPAGKEQQKEQAALPGTEEHNEEERKEDEARKDKDVANKNSQSEEPPVPETPMSHRKKAPSTPTRMTTRGRRTVTFVSPVTDEGEGIEINIPAPASPSRTPRKTKQAAEQKVQATTPRRSTRKAQQEPPKEEVEEKEAVENDITAVAASMAASPARRRTAQKSASTRSSQKTQGVSEVSTAAEVEEGMNQEHEVTEKIAVPQTSSKTLTPAKRRATQESTPKRRSQRQIMSSREVEVTPLEVLKEEEEEVFAPPVSRSTRKTNTEASETQSALEEDTKQPIRSPGRTTRQSNRVSLNALPQSTRTTRGKKRTENMNENEDLHVAEVNSSASRANSRRPTRSKLWDHQEENLLLLDSPLEVDSQTPVADALIKRLQDEEVKREGAVELSKVVRTNQRSTRSSVEPVQEPQDDETSPGEHSFVYSPSRRRARASRAGSVGPMEEPATPATRSRRRANRDGAAQEEVTSVEEDDHVGVDKGGASRSKNPSKRTARSKEALEPPPVAEVDLISPPPSPADPLPRAQKAKGGEAPTSSMNLRRKRIMENVFTKPVTRRKKL
ncbi:protein ELYS isoform X3 [Betta splendens]|uniref:Protein ELYS isoform X3 n=1 Tax=Betta splendens TaxID=158456 RepID=A0A6P7M1E9_BETSP|nr:protein ELYS isoform X3 [Betta splendens]